MKKLLVSTLAAMFLLGSLTFAAPPNKTTDHGQGNTGNGNSGNGVGNTGPGNQGNGPNPNSGNAGGNHGGNGSGGSGGGNGGGSGSGSGGNGGSGSGSGGSGSGSGGSGGVGSGSSGGVGSGGGSGNGGSSGGGFTGGSGSQSGGPNGIGTGSNLNRNGGVEIPAGGGATQIYNPFVFYPPDYLPGSIKPEHHDSVCGEGNRYIYAVPIQESPFGGVIKEYCEDQKIYIYPPVNGLEATQVDVDSDGSVHLR